MSGSTPLGSTAANPFMLPNDWVLTVEIDALTAAGTVVGLPAGDVPTVVSSVPASFNAVIGATAAGLPAIVVNALVDGSVAPTTVYSTTLTDSAGLASDELFWQIIADTTPTSLGTDLPHATHTSQAVPPVG